MVGELIITQTSEDCKYPKKEKKEKKENLKPRPGGVLVRLVKSKPFKLSSMERKETASETTKMVSEAVEIVDNTEKIVNEFSKAIAKLQPEALLDTYKNNFNNKLETTKAEKEEKEKKEEILESYREMVAKLKKSMVILAKIEDVDAVDYKGYNFHGKKARAIYPFYKSRYSESGRKQKKRDFEERLDTVSDGIFITLTYDHKRFTLLQAWMDIAKRITRTLNTLKVEKKRDLKEYGNEDLPFEYARVIEVQENWYPHVHIFIPDLVYLFPQEKIADIWGAGFIYVQHVKHANIGRYMSKYMTKGERLEKLLPFVWYFHIRLYSFSRSLALPKKEEKTEKEKYVCLGFCSNTPDSIRRFAWDHDISSIEFFGRKGYGITFLDSKVGTEELDYQFNEDIQNFYLIMPAIKFIVSIVPKFYLRV